MTTSLAKIQPGQMPRAAGWNLLVDDYNAGRTDRSGPPGGRLPPSLGLVTIKNVSGSDRARFDCMALGNPTQTIGNAVEESLIFEADTADPNETPVILQEPIANGQCGIGCIFGQTFAKIATAATTSEIYGTPSAAGHNLAVGTDPTAIKLLALPSTSTATVRPILIGQPTAAVQLRVRVNGRALEYSTDGGATWLVWGRMNLRLSGSNYQFTIDDHEVTPTWTNWLETTNSCPPPP